MFHAMSSALTRAVFCAHCSVNASSAPSGLSVTVCPKASALMLSVWPTVGLALSLRRKVSTVCAEMLITVCPSKGISSHVISLYSTSSTPKMRPFERFDSLMRTMWSTVDGS